MRPSFFFFKWRESLESWFLEQTVATWRRMVMQFQWLIVMREKPVLPCKSLNGPDEAFGGEGLLQDGSLDWSAPGAFCRHLITRESCLQGAGYSQAFSSLPGLTSEIGRRSCAIHIKRQTEFVSHSSKCHFPSCTELSFWSAVISEPGWKRLCSIYLSRGFLCKRVWGMCIARLPVPVNQSRLNIRFLDTHIHNIRVIVSCA